MQQYTRKPDSKHAINECLGWPLQAQVKMTVEKNSIDYNLGDFVILYIDPAGVFRLAFIPKDELTTNFQLSTDQKLKEAVQEKFTGHDPFRPQSTEVPPETQPQKPGMRITPQKVRLGNKMMAG